MESHLLNCAECAQIIQDMEEADRAFSDFSVGELPAQHFAGYAQNVRARVQAEILGKLAQRDPAAGLARLAALAPTLRAGTDSMRLVTEILRAAAKKNPAAAIAAVDGLPEKLQKSAIGSSLVGWADENPVDALTWGAAHFRCM